LVFSGVIPIGAKNVTNDLAIGLRVSLESAEKIKVFLSESDKKTKKTKESDADLLDLTSLGFGDAKRVSKKTLTDGIIRPRLNEIFSMVKLYLEKENLAVRIPSGIILTGGGAETVGVVESARRMLSLPVRVGKPKGVGGLIDDVINPSYATAVGLLLYGMQNSQRTELTSISKKFKLPSIGFAGKIVESIKNLLP
jgi:cell division protein FtsA